MNSLTLITGFTPIALVVVGVFAFMSSSLMSGDRLPSRSTNQRKGVCNHFVTYQETDIIIPSSLALALLSSDLANGL